MLPGQIGWIDLTVPDASALRDFYSSAAGWTPSPVPMGDYQDFSMHPPGQEQPVAGICRATGANAGLPAVWLISITVADLEAALQTCLAGGGKSLRLAEAMGAMGRYGVIQDPAGAACARFEPARP
jgi:predicted enzyme related to lactoylglutathione lyase